MRRLSVKEVRYRPTNGEKTRILSVANEDRRLKAAAFRILEYLLQHHNDRIGLVCPSQRRIAKDLGLSERWVREMVRLLRSAGYIKTTRIGGSRGHFRYFFRLEKLKSFGNPRGMRGDQGLEQGGNAVQPEAERTDHRNCGAGKYIKNNIKKEPAKSEGASSTSRHDVVVHRLGQMPTKPKQRNDSMSALANELGGGEDAWNVLLRLERAEVEEIQARLDMHQLTLAEAKMLVLNAAATKD